MTKKDDWGIYKQTLISKISICQIRFLQNKHPPHTLPSPLGDCVTSPFMVRQNLSWAKSKEGLTMNGPRHIKNQLFTCLPAGRAVRPERVEGGTANYDTVSWRRGLLEMLPFTKPLSEQGGRSKWQRHGFRTRKKRKTSSVFTEKYCNSIIPFIF